MQSHAVTNEKGQLKVLESFHNLEASACRAEAFPSRLDWYVHFAETTLQANEHLRIYVWERVVDGQVLATWPCVWIQARRGPVCLGILRSMTNYYSPLFGPLVRPGHSDAFSHLIRAVLSTNQVDILELFPLNPRSESYACLSNIMRESGWHAQCLEHVANWSAPIDGNFDSYVAARPSRVRRTWQRKLKKFSQHAENRLFLAVHTEDVINAIDDYEVVYARSWKEPEPYPTFVPGLIRRCAEAGTARLGLAYSGDQPIAAHFWIVENNVAHIYKLAYDQDFAAFSPGTLVMMHLMEYVIDVDVVSKVDFLTGDDNYKRDWMSHKQYRMSITGFNSGTLAGRACMVRSRAKAILAKLSRLNNA